MQAEPKQRKALVAGKYRHTSVSLRRASQRRVRAALKILRRNGIIWSESEILFRLAKMYLAAWRGFGEKSDTARRYSLKGAQHGKYVRMPWYVDRVVHAALWERSVHSGLSISRMLDFAIRYYVPRLMEYLLPNPYNRCRRAQRNFAYWHARAERRFPKRAAIFITYSWSTERNDRTGLNFHQESRYLTKEQLSGTAQPAITGNS
jgi:hypothetical protein